MDENLSEQIDTHLNEIFQANSDSFKSSPKLIVLNKIDLIPKVPSLTKNPLAYATIPISCTSGLNIEEFLSKLTASIAEK